MHARTRHLYATWWMALGAGFLFAFGARAWAADPTPASAATQPATQKSKEVGELVPSEDALVKDLHSLGLINGRVNIFRSASPARDLVKGKEALADAAAQSAEAQKRMRHLYDLGIRTIISLEDPDPTKEETESSASGAQRVQWITLEKSAAAAAGIAFVSRPVDNTGKDSLETFSDQEVRKELEALSTEVFAAAAKGGVLFHCAAGHDRTGILAAYIRVRYQQWPVEQAIEEMRRFGHNWVKYSKNQGVSSWHEDHLRGIAQILSKETK